MSKKGICWLIGAGPGDPGLLTLKAKECIEQAEVSKPKRGYGSSARSGKRAR